MDLLSLINKTFSFEVGSWNISPTYWQAAAILFLIFLLLLTFARLRYLYIHWSMGKSAIAFLFWGFLLALILEGFLIIGGRTVFTEIMGWRNMPKPIGTALDAGRARLVEVLGVTEEIPQSRAETPASYQSVVADYLNLTPEDQNTVRSFICKPD